MKKAEKYSNRFKASIAIRAVDEESIRELASGYAVPADTIRQWARELRERAELLFMDDNTAEPRQAVQNQAALLRSTLEASPNGILVTDLERNIITYNQKCLEMWKVPEHLTATENMKGVLQHILQMLQDPGVYRKQIESLYASPETLASDVMKLKDGRYFQRSTVPHRVGYRIIGHVTNFVDITQYKKTEEKLARFGGLLNSINTNVNEGILRSTPDEGLIYVNDAFVKMFGYQSEEEALATHPAAFYADREDRWQLLNKLKNHGSYKNEEVRLRRKDGEIFWGLESSTLVRQNGETYIDAVVTDIDCRKQAEQALRKSEEKYRSILKNIREGYYETNLAGDFTFFNVAMVEMLGYPAEDIFGMNNREFMDEQNARKVYKTFNRVYETGKPEKGFDWEIIRGDGSRIYVEASVTLRRGPEGEPVGFSGVVRDVTERKRKQQQIRESLREKEVLLGEIHHRVKNNLAVISGLLYLQADKTDDRNAYQALMESQSRINSMALIHELLYDNHTFASLNPRIYIEQLVEHISSNLRTQKTDISTHIEAENFDLEMSTAIPCALIINELITNAYKYAFDGRSEGTVKIKFHKEEDSYRLEVADDGKGLPEGLDITRSDSHSLGFSLVKTLTRQLRGHLETDNSNGARFVITFPS